MRDDELDRLLAGAPVRDPGPAFTRAVMEQVHQQAEAPAPIPFPWRRVAAGLSICATAIVALVLVAEPPAATEIPRLPGGALRAGFLAASTLLLSWLTLRVTAIFSGARA